ncbi:hypothetical protein ACIGXM_34610 [Kitasatospora sp. NPDC052896]|uniref:hypothetical protein n=1 Tax=Kitasatospora sp. NPDC052896 TaxID=3364061 RepID=UPI0037CA004B
MTLVQTRAVLSWSTPAPARRSRSLGDDEPTGDRMPGLPDNPIYQHILTALIDAAAPQRCRDLCRTLATGTEPTHISGMRNKLKRLTSAGLVVETEPGLFAIPTPRTAD